VRRAITIVRLFANPHVLRLNTQESTLACSTSDKDRTNLKERIADHNRVDALEDHFTRKNGPWRLVWWEKHDFRAQRSESDCERKPFESFSRYRKPVISTTSLRISPREKSVGLPFLSKSNQYNCPEVKSVICRGFPPSIGSAQMFETPFSVAP
jgi:predicted GIY-YIG superfamily endonuclease